jgi:hypothetical protein
MPFYDGVTYPEVREMTDQLWTWASLDDGAVALVEEAERTLGSDIVLVYAEGDRRNRAIVPDGLQPAALDPSGLDCLAGLERMVHGVAVAYRRIA